MDACASPASGSTRVLSAVGFAPLRRDSDLRGKRDPPRPCAIHERGPTRRTESGLAAISDGSSARDYGAQVASNPFVRLNTDAVQNAPESRYHS